MSLPIDPARFLSPSLRSAVDGGRPESAYEVKFALTPELADRLIEWAASRMQLDPHCGPSTGGSYRVASIYCDTPERSVLLRDDGFRRRKFRVRRYGDGTTVFLERKTKSGTRVVKRRIAVPLPELVRLHENEPTTDWAGDWFRSAVRRRRLIPVCTVEYDRTAFGADTPEGHARLTLDRGLIGRRIADWSYESAESGRPLAERSVIAEFKFARSMPLLIKGAIAELALEPSGMSKYRLCCGAFGDC